MNKENTKQTGSKKSKRKLIFIIAGILVVLLACIILLIPVYVSSQPCRNLIISKINENVSGKADFADLSMGWIKGISIKDISFEDLDGKFSFQAKEISTKPKYGALLTANLSLGETIVSEPKIKLALGNNSEVEKVKEEKSSSKSGGTFALPISRIDLTVNNGNVKITDEKSKVIELADINARLDLQPSNKKSSFALNTNLVDGEKSSAINADAQVSSGLKKSGLDVSAISGTMTVEVNDLDLSSLGPIFALAGFEAEAKGNLSINLESKIQKGNLQNLKGNINGKNIDVKAPQLKGDSFKTSVLNSSFDIDSDKKFMKINNLQAKTDWLQIDAQGDFPVSFSSLTEFVEMKTDKPLQASINCDLAQVANQMPNLLGLKEQTSLKSGRLEGRLEKTVEGDMVKITAAAKVSDIAGVVEAKDVALSEPVIARAEISADGSKVNFDKLELSASFAKMTGRGTSEQIKYEAEVFLDKMQSEFGQFVDFGLYKMSGAVKSSGEVVSSEEKINVVNTSDFQQVVFAGDKGKSLTEPDASLNFDISIDKKDKSIDAKSFKADMSFGQIEVKSGSIISEPRAVNLPVSAKVDLNKLQPVIAFFATLPEGLQIYGLAESNLEVSSKEDIYRIATDDTKIKGLKVTSPDKLPFEQAEVAVVLDAEYDLKNNSIKLLGNPELVSNDIKIKLNLEKLVESDTTKLAGKVGYEVNLASVSPLLAQFAPSGFSMSGTSKDEILFSADYPTSQPELMMANLDTKGAIGFEKAEYMGLEFSQTKLPFEMAKGSLTIGPLSSTVNNGQLNFAAKTDFKSQLPILQMTEQMQIVKDVQINDKMSRELLMYLNPLFANAVGVTGVANFNCEKLSIPLEGKNTNAIEMIGTVSISELKLSASSLLGDILSIAGASTGGQILTIHPTRFVLKDGFLSYDNMQVDIGKNPVIFKGVIGLDKSLDMTISLPPGLLGKIASDKSISVPIKGTLNKPEIDTSKLLEGQIKERLFEELDKVFK